MTTAHNAITEYFLPSPGHESMTAEISLDDNGDPTILVMGQLITLKADGTYSSEPV